MALLEHTESEGHTDRQADRQIGRVSVWAPAVAAQQTDRWSFGCMLLR